MEIKLLVCCLFFIFITFQSLLISAHETNFTSEQHRGFELSEHHLQGKQLRGINETRGMNNEGRSGRRDEAGGNDRLRTHKKKDCFDGASSGLPQGNGGSFDGASSGRPQGNGAGYYGSSYSGATSLLTRPSSLITNTLLILQLSIPLLLALRFFF